jgi:CDP-diacylglycerol pyrophosphatase
MNLPARGGSRNSLAWLLALGALLALVPPASGGNPNALWEIVDRCMDPQVTDYCTSCPSPRVETACAANRGCRETTEVWAETPEFVVIRDRKMCGCPDDFVHGLAIPRGRVSGVEDPHRPEGIWPFAWSQAQRRIHDVSSIALVVNPASTRSQDQLHVHLLRLRDDARAALATAATVRVQELSTVWREAARLAETNRLPDYGVLVASDPAGGFLVVVDDRSPERLYGVEHCAFPVRGPQ